LFGKSKLISMKAKEILYDILHAHCLTTQNTDKVIKLAGIPTSIYNGKRDYWMIRKMILRIVSEERARQIINAMPYSFIENWSRKEDKHKAWIRAMFPEMFRITNLDTFTFYRDNVLQPLPLKAGYRMENIEGYAEFVAKPIYRISPLNPVA